MRRRGAMPTLRSARSRPWMQRSSRRKRRGRLDSRKSGRRRRAGSDRQRSAASSCRASRPPPWCAQLGAERGAACWLGATQLGAEPGVVGQQLVVLDIRPVPPGRSAATCRKRTTESRTHKPRRERSCEGGRRSDSNHSRPTGGGARPPPEGTCSRAARPRPGTRPRRGTPGTAPWARSRPRRGRRASTCPGR